jgi:hypothetical protein
MVVNLIRAFVRMRFFPLLIKVVEKKFSFSCLRLLQMSWRSPCFSDNYWMGMSVKKGFDDSGIDRLNDKKSGLYQSCRFKQNFILPRNKIGCQHRICIFIKKML